MMVNCWLTAGQQIVMVNAWCLKMVYDHGGFGDNGRKQLCAVEHSFVLVSCYETLG